MDQADSSRATSEAPRAPVAAVKTEQDEVDELAGETDAIAALPAPASHQHLQAVLLQQQQLQRSRPTHPTASQRTAQQQGSAASGSQQQQLQIQNTAQGFGQSQNRCAICGSVSASLWRREPHGQAICNACGLASIKRSGQQPQNALKSGSPRQTNGNHLPYAQKEDLAQTTNLSNASEASTPRTLTSALPAQVAFSAGRQGSTAQHLSPPGQIQAVTSPRQQLSQDQSSVPRGLLSPQFDRSNDEWRRPPANASNGVTNGTVRYAVSSGDSVKVVPNQRTDAPVGSCPGDGRCNGQGGKAACTGCPAFNNRHRIVTNTSNGRKQPEYSPRASPHPVSLPLANREDFTRSSGDGPTSVHQSHSSDPSANATAARTAVDAPMQAQEGSEISAMACENCGTRTTPLWRRDGEGRVACNACGLYYKLHGSHRPVNMNKTTIKRRKRVPAVAGSQEGSIAGSAGPSGDQHDTGGGPAKKKARKNQQNADSRHQYNGAMSNGGAHDVHNDTSHSQRELTRTELEVIAALAMNANHERSLQHSASLDSDLLDHHSHPLHSVPASVPNDRFGSLVPPLAQPASELSFGSPQDRASVQSLTSEEDQIALYKQELAQECDRARSTMSRLQDFLVRSESVLASLDERLRQVKAASSRSGESKEAGPSPLKHEIVHAASPAINGDAEQPVETLEHILANFHTSQARPSQLLRKRKIDAVHDSKGLHRAGSGAVESGSAGRKKLLWEICPSGTTKIEVIASKPPSEGSLVLPAGIVAN